MYYAFTGDGTAWSPAVVIDIEDIGLRAYTAYNEEYVDAPDIVLSSETIEQSYGMIYQNFAGSVMLWDMQGQPDDLNTLEAVKPIKDQSVTVAYLNEDNGVYTLKTAERTLVGVVKLLNDGSGVVKLSEQIEGVSGYPGVLLSDGKCVGILYSDNKAYVEWFDSETFDPDAESTTEAAADNESEEGSAKSAISWQLIVCIAASVVLVGAVAIFLIKERKQEELPVNRSKQTGRISFDDYGETEPSPVKRHSEKRINPYSETMPAEKGGKLFLACRGGYMDGRVYPIESNIVTIGRSPSCTIKYPADYRGISREHATIRLENGLLTLTDTSSTGIYLQRIQGKAPVNQPIRIEAGDVFYLGEQKNRFEVVQKF